MKCAALVIINAKYSCDDYCNLQWVKDDGDKMMKMLSNHHFNVTTDFAFYAFKVYELILISGGNIE